MDGRSMRRIGMIVMAAATLIGAVAVSAQVVDLSTITCKQFIESDKDTIGSLLMWLDGYYTHNDAPAVIDFDKMKVKGKKLGEYCAKNPSIGLVTAAEPILSGD
jgi:acid stress chaperone HdeB